MSEQGSYAMSEMLRAWFFTPVISLLRQIIERHQAFELKLETVAKTNAVGNAHVALMFKELERKLELMQENQEQLLNNAINELSNAITNANQRVIDELEQMRQNRPDLSDEIRYVQEMALRVNQIAAEQVQTAPPPPPPEPPGTEQPTAEATSTESTGNEGEDESSG